MTTAVDAALLWWPLVAVITIKSFFMLNGIKIFDQSLKNQKDDNGHIENIWGGSRSAASYQAAAIGWRLDSVEHWEYHANEDV